MSIKKFPIQFSLLNKLGQPALAILGFVILTSCGGGPDMTGKYKPEPNPNPQYFMSVEGQVAPELAKFIDIKWQATYIGTDKQWDYLANSIGCQISICN